MVHLTGRHMERDGEGECIAYWKDSSSIFSRTLLFLKVGSTYYWKNVFISYSHRNNLATNGIFYVDL